MGYFCLEGLPPERVWNMVGRNLGGSQAKVARVQNGTDRVQPNDPLSETAWAVEVCHDLFFTAPVA